MVKANTFQCFQQQHPAPDSSNLRHLRPLFQFGLQNSLSSCMNPCTFSPDANLLDFSDWYLGQPNEAQGFQHFPSSMEGLPYHRKSQFSFSNGHEVEATTDDVAGLIQKKFLVFDQSGNQTRLFLSPSFTPFTNPINAPKRPVHACDQHEQKQFATTERIFPEKPDIHGQLDLNNPIGDGSEMHENTEEIDALLYSDDDENDDIDSEDNEASNMGHFLKVMNGNHDAQVEEIAEDVASSDGSTKRQRLLYGGYKKLPSGATQSSAKLDKSCDSEDDAESSCAKGRIPGVGMDSFSGNKQSRQDKIWETLRILKCIIPGIKGHNPLLVIDEAIDYLKYLKLKAKAVGMGYP